MVIFGESLPNDACRHVRDPAFPRAHTCHRYQFKRQLSQFHGPEIYLSSLPWNRTVISHSVVHGPSRRLRPHDPAGSRMLVTRHASFHQILPGRIVRIHVLLFFAMARPWAVGSLPVCGSTLKH